MLPWTPVKGTPTFAEKEGGTVLVDSVVVERVTDELDEGDAEVDPEKVPVVEEVDERELVDCDVAVEMLPLLDPTIAPRFPSAPYALMTLGAMYGVVLLTE